jgi:oleandomycin transport system ATP-binding protein
VCESTAGTAAPAIEATDVTKRFGTVTALAGVDLTVPAGSIAALLGPNGAGKTTLVRIIATLTRPDGGHARVLGADVAREPQQVRRKIGLTGQYAGLDEALTGQDNLILIGRLAGLGRRAARSRAAELASAFGLAPALPRVVRTYSGGMRRRLDLAASLMTGPAVLILDEPTTGLDPASRQQLWAVLTGLRAEGITMLLTTQYLEEADNFADTVHVLSHGEVIASGTPARLKEQAGQQVAEIRLASPQDAPEASRWLAQRVPAAVAGLRSEPQLGRLTIPADGPGTLLAAAAALQDAGITVVSLGLRPPSLDEAFLALTRGTEVAA